MPLLDDRRRGYAIAIIAAAVAIAGTCEPPSWAGLAAPVEAEAPGAAERGPSAPDGRVRTTREYDLKAAFLFHFPQFVEWPSDAFPSSDSPIVICILGPDPFEGVLDEMVDRETVRGRRLVVQRARDQAEASSCHILFLGAESGHAAETLPRKLHGKALLTVGETDDFESAGGIVRFVTVDSKLRLRINAGEARSSRITISSKLLRQAQIVGTSAR